MCGESIRPGTAQCHNCGERIRWPSHKPTGHSGRVDADFVQRVQRELEGIGVFWFCVCVFEAFVAFATLSVRSPNGDLSLSGAPAAALSAVVCFLVGLFTYLKWRGAIQAGVYCGYAGALGIFAQFVAINPCAPFFGVVLFLTVALHSHRVVQWVLMMESEGVPLNAKPEDLE